MFKLGDKVRQIGSPYAGNLGAYFGVVGKVGTVVELPDEESYLQTHEVFFDSLTYEGDDFPGDTFPFRPYEIELVEEEDVE